MNSSPVLKFKSTGVIPLHSYIVGASLNGSAVCLIQFPKLYLQKLDFRQFTFHFTLVVSVCEPLNVLQMHVHKQMEI